MCKLVDSQAFSSPEATILLVSTKNRDHWPEPICWTCAEYSFYILNQSDLSDLTVSPRLADFRYWNRLISYPGPTLSDRGWSGYEIKNRPEVWCWPKGLWPLGTRMTVPEDVRLIQVVTGLTIFINGKYLFRHSGSTSWSHFERTVSQPWNSAHPLKISKQIMWNESRQNLQCLYWKPNDIFPNKKPSLVIYTAEIKVS